MNKNILNPHIVWPDFYNILKWAGIGMVLGLIALYYVTLLTGPAQALLGNIPYTVIPVILLTYTVTHLTNKNKKTHKYQELLDTIHMNVYISFAYFLFQLIMYLATNALDYNIENDIKLRERVYLGLTIGMIFFLFAIFVIYKYL